jgi:hypothetical protein
VLAACSPGWAAGRWGACHARDSVAQSPRVREAVPCKRSAVRANPSLAPDSSLSLQLRTPRKPGIWHRNPLTELAPLTLTWPGGHAWHCWWARTASTLTGHDAADDAEQTPRQRGGQLDTSSLGRPQPLAGRGIGEATNSDLSAMTRAVVAPVSGWCSNNHKQENPPALRFLGGIGRKL